MFRHGVRAPLPGFEPKIANIYSGQGWPDLADWKVPQGKTWGDLTTHGFDLAKALGRYYAEWYRNNGWSGGFKAYLYADTDQRTIDTADALFQGLQQGGIPKDDLTMGRMLSKLSTKNEPSPINVDPLFHPFEARCGAPNSTTLGSTVTKIENAWPKAMQKLASNFADLYGILNCAGPTCFQLQPVVDIVAACPDRDGKCPPGKTCESPISWCRRDKKPFPAQFPYASSASEAFLLEYANNMPLNLVGWGKVVAAKNLGPLLQLHEAYFDLTERQSYLATIQGSNLIREIRDLIGRTAETLEPIEFKCLLADKASQFVGLVGHDTNIAGVGDLLDLSWEFDDAHLPPGQHLPPDTLNLPRNDALPAGALVFELRQRAGQYFVRIEYVAQSLLQMRGDPKRPPTDPFRFSVTCHDERGTLNPCEMPLVTFEKLATKALGSNNPFVSRCADGQQVCP